VVCASWNDFQLTPYTDEGCQCRMQVTNVSENVAPLIWWKLTTLTAGFVGEEVLAVRVGSIYDNGSYISSIYNSRCRLAYTGHTISRRYVAPPWLMAVSMALGNRCSKSRIPTQVGRTAIRAICDAICRTFSTQAFPPSSPK
jgi:hypothetical protein